MRKVFDAPVAVQRPVPMVQTVQISVVGPPLLFIDKVVDIPVVGVVVDVAVITQRQVPAVLRDRSSEQFIDRVSRRCCGGSESQFSSSTDSVQLDV